MIRSYYTFRSMGFQFHPIVSLIMQGIDIVIKLLMFVVEWNSFIATNSNFKRRLTIGFACVVNFSYVA